MRTVENRRYCHQKNCQSFCTYWSNRYYFHLLRQKTMGHFETQLILFCSLLFRLAISLNPSQTFHTSNSLKNDRVGEGQNRCQSDCFRNSTTSTELKNISLVCGSDGVTYLGFEEINCVRRSCGKEVRLLRYGRCLTTQGTGGTPHSPFPKHQQYQYQLPKGDGMKEAEQSLFFPVQPAPVSGEVKSGSRQYWGGHQQNRNGKKVCIPDECNCPQAFRPLCGSDSVTYGSECLMECNRKCKPDVVKFHDGHCGRPFGKSGCRECGCPDDNANLQPVCGSDNVTYWNRCVLECDRSCSPDLEFNHSGYCGRVFFPSLNL